MEDFTDKKFNKLTGIREAKSREDRHGRLQPYWLFRCDCGNEKEIKLSNVLSGNSKSCGKSGCSARNTRYNNEQKEKIKKYLTKENLEKYLPIYSANYIAKRLFYPDFVSCAGHVIKIAKSYGIKTHNSSESRDLQSTKNQIKATCVARYGVESISEIPSVKEKKIKSAIREYGVINVFQSDEIKEKSRVTCLEKYGVEKIGHLGLSSSRGKLSKFHLKIEALLNKNNIIYESEVGGKFVKYNTHLKSKYSPIVDILIENSKLVIECNGDFWHANPKIYKKDDIFDTWEGKKTAKEIWDKDDSRTKQIESFGYVVLIIWQSEYDKDYKLIEKRILNAIKNSENKKTKQKRKTNKI